MWFLAHLCTFFTSQSHTCDECEMNSIQPSNEDIWGCLSWAFRALLTCFPTWLPGAAMPSEQEEEYDCWRWWWWRWRVPPPRRQGLEYQTTRRRERVESPRWEHDPITGLCNRSEPHSALYNSIRSAHCSQLDRQCHCDTKQCGSKHNFMHTAAVSEGRCSRCQHPCWSKCPNITIHIVNNGIDDW